MSRQEIIKELEMRKNQLATEKRVAKNFPEWHHYNTYLVPSIEWHIAQLENKLKEM